MGCSMKLFTVVSLLLLVSMSPDIGGPVRVDAIASCSYMDLCVKYCNLAAPGKGACCPGLGPCRCTSICPRSGWPSVINDVKDEVCDRDHCADHCKSKGKYGCCAGYPGRCTCRDTPACPLYVTVEIPENEDVVVKKLIA